MQAGLVFGTAAEFEADSLLQEAQETFSRFSLFREDALALVVAEHTEEQRLTTLPAHHAHATAAHDLTAMGTLKGSHQFFMARANQGAVFQPGRRFGSGKLALDFRDGNGDVGGLDQQLHVAEPDGLTLFQPNLGDGLAVDEGAIG